MCLFLWTLECGALCNNKRQFARVVKGVDLRSTGGNSAWVRTPQLTSFRAMSWSALPPAAFFARPPRVVELPRGESRRDFASSKLP